MLVAAAPVGVYLDFDEPPSETSIKAMRQEAAVILGPVGIHIAWRLVSQNRGNEPFEQLAVVKFTGKCACGRFLQAPGESMVLGTTAVVAGRVLPFSQIRCDAVRSLFHDIEFAPNPRLGDAALGRVLGRVLVHELYHSLQATTRHSDSGLAKGRQTTEELESDRYFDSSDWKLSPSATR